jgi:hypothetical protein
MARTRTLVQLRAEVRERADIENDPHITDPEITRFVNQSIAALHGKLVQLSEDDFTATQTIATVAGVSGYALSVKFYKLISVEITANGNTRRAERWTWAEHARYRSASSSWSLPRQPISYRLVGSDAIELRPAPDGVYDVTVYCALAQEALVADADVYDGRDGWEEWVVLDAAIKCKTKSEESVTDLVRERAEVMARIEAAMGTKDQALPDRVSDVISGDPFDLLPVRGW